MQKTVVVDYLSHKAKKNNNIVPKYIMENHHPAIISREKFEEARAIRLAKHSSRSRRKPVVNLLSEIFICENCLRPMQVITIHPGTRFHKRVFTCKTKSKSSKKYKECNAKSTVDYVLLIQAVDHIFRKYYEMPNFDETIITEAHQDAIMMIINKIDEYKNRMEANAKEMNTCAKLQVTEKGDVSKHQNKFNELKRDNEFYETEINRLLGIIADNNKQYQIKTKLMEYKQNGILSYEALTTIVKGAIRRKDNSIRFIISNSPIKINEISIKDYLNKESIYQSMVNNKNSSLMFDVIKLEDATNE